MMFPFLASAGGSCQFAVILVEEAAVTVKLAGASRGTVINHAKTGRSLAWS